MIIVLSWLPIEDAGEWFVIILAAAISTWLGVRFLFKSALNKQRLVLTHSITGLVAGLAVSLVAIILMAVKTGLHGHDEPDFSPEQIVTVLNLTPFFGVSGMFMGLGSGIIRKEFDKDATQS